MARPHKSPTDRHSESVRVSLRPADLARIQSQADKAETTVTDFVRASALGQKLTVIQSDAPDFDTVEQLRRIGVNLNQIAKAMNAQTTVQPAELKTVCMKLETLLDKWLFHDTSHDHRPKL